MRRHSTQGKGGSSADEFTGDSGLRRRRLIIIPEMIFLTVYFASALNSIESVRLRGSGGGRGRGGGGRGHRDSAIEATPEIGSRKIVGEKINDIIEFFIWV